MEIMEAKIFYQIFSSTDKNWETKITDLEIRDGLKKKVSFEFIRLVKDKLIKQGVFTINGEIIKVNYTNTRLY